MTDQELAEQRAAAMAEVNGSTAQTTSTTEVTPPVVPQEASPSTPESTPTPETTQVTTPEPTTPSQPEKKEVTKKDLYKALGKKNKEIEELRALVEEKSKDFDSDTLELIEAVSKKNTLEKDFLESEKRERDSFLATLPDDIKTDLVSELEDNPSAWRTVQKFYKPTQSAPVPPPTPKSNISIIGNT